MSASNSTYTTSSPPSSAYSSGSSSINVVTSNTYVTPTSAATKTAAPSVWGTCKPSIPATCAAGGLGGKNTWYLTKPTVISSGVVETITSGGRTWTTTSTIPITTITPTGHGSLATNSALGYSPQFSSGISNASLNHGGLSIILFVVYILHFLFRV